MNRKFSKCKNTRIKEKNKNNVNDKIKRTVLQFSRPKGHYIPEKKKKKKKRKKKEREKINLS